jgi:hypothetical protein
MAMAVDEPRKNGAAVFVHRHSGFRPRLARAEEANDLPVVSDHEAREMLQMSCGIDLDSIDVVDERVGAGGSGEQSCGEREQDRCFHVRWLSIVRRAVKG